MANDGTVKIGTDLDDSGFKSGLSKLGSVAKGALTGVTAGVGAASAAIGALSTQALNAYASYEQLVGGVETLFKDSADTIQEYAANAYKTAGVSANSYMEQATAFSASLIQSLGGDTEAAAEYANQAIMDMSDNANKMGTGIESIQMTYQSLMRGNYAMLDNLKLGYGGTKAELERLVKDAEQLTGKALDPTKFSDVITAIHAVQENLGITGTTAKEASTTIEGSVNAMKAAFENLLTGIGDENADLETLIDNFVSTAETAAGNILPRLTQILSGVGEVVEQLAPIIATQLPTVINSVLPSMVSAGAQLLVGLAQGLITATPTLLASVPSIVQSIVTSLSASGPSMMSAGFQLLSMLANGIMTGLPVLSESAVTIMGNLAQYVRDNLPSLIETGLEALVSFSGSLRENAGLLVDGALGLIQSLASGLIASLPALIETVPEIVTNIAGVINDNAPKLVATAAVLLGQLSLGLIQAIPTLVANIPQIIEAIVAVFTAFNWVNLGQTIITALKDGIVSMVLTAKSGAGEILKAVNDGLAALPSNLLNMGKQGITGLVNGVKSMIGSVGTTIQSIGSTVLNGLKSIPSQVIEIGKNIVQGLIDGISSGISGVATSIADLATTAIDKAKDVLGIHSPSKVMRDQVGKNIGLGTAEGITDSIPSAKSAAQKLAKSIPAVTMGVKYANASMTPVSASTPRFSTENALAQAAGLMALSNQGNSAEIVLQLSNGKEIARWLVPNIRSVEKQTPEIQFN